VTTANDITERGREKHAHKIEVKIIKLERLRPARLICRDLNVMNSRHVKTSSKITDSSLLAYTTNQF
jgi:uncharacterized protein YcfJ